MTIHAARPRRSVLYVPGSNSRALEKCRQLPVDGVILDLEDAVLPSAKPAARAAVVAAVAGGGFGRREIAIRVNGTDTPWYGADMEAAAGSGADAIVLPKVDDAGCVHQAVACLERLGAPAGLAVWVMAETPRGVLALADIAASSDRMQVIVLGTADLGKALRVRSTPDRDGLTAALSHCVLAARAHRLDILDGVFTDLEDHAGFAAACRQGKALGFDGKTLIHPGQIQAANETYGVTAGEAARAAAIVAAWEAAEAAGQGIAVFEGRMIERLHADEARRQLALHAEQVDG